MRILYELIFFFFPLICSCQGWLFVANHLNFSLLFADADGAIDYNDSDEVELRSRTRFPYKINELGYMHVNRGVLLTVFYKHI